MKTRSSRVSVSPPPSPVITGRASSTWPSYVADFREEASGLFNHFLLTLLIFLCYVYSSPSSSFLSSLSSVLSGCSPVGSDLFMACLQFQIIAFLFMLPGLLWEWFPFLYGFAALLGLMGVRGLLVLTHISSASTPKHVLGVSGGWRDFSNWTADTSVIGGGTENWVGGLWGYLQNAGGVQPGDEWLFYVCLFHCLLYIFYALRAIGIFVWRSTRVESYQQYSRKLDELVEAEKDKSGIYRDRFFCILGMSSFVIFFYPPLYYLLDNLQRHQTHSFVYATPPGKSHSGCCIKMVMVVQLLGYITAFKGTVIELVADVQKQLTKEKAIHARTRSASKEMVVRSGLYKYAQQPNYLGEIMWQCGMLLGSIGGFACEPLRWVIGSFGFGMMVVVLWKASKKLRENQRLRYGGDRVYEEYVKKTNVMWINGLKVWKDWLGIGQGKRKSA